MLLGPAAGREGRAEGGGAARLEVSEPLEPRETGAGCVTARRPPCQQAGLPADPAPGGSPCVASDAQVRRAAGLQGIRRLGGRGAADSRSLLPGRCPPGSCSGSLCIRPLSVSLGFPRFSAGVLLSRIAPISPRALASPGILRLLLRVGVSLLGGPSPVLARFPAGGF